MRRHAPRSLAISDRRLLATSPDDDVLRHFERWTRRLLACGVEALQIREKDLEDGFLFDVARRVVTTVRQSRLPECVVLVNGRPDIALACGADGVHLPSDGLPITEVRRAFGRDFLIGHSTHRLSEVHAAAAQGADFVTFGPVFHTPSKASYGAPQGLEMLRQACAAPLPVLALGGIESHRLAAIAETGAAGVAAIREFVRQPEALGAATIATWPSQMRPRKRAGASTSGTPESC